MKLKAQKIILLALVVLMLVGITVGCNSSTNNRNGNVSVSIGGWPTETDREKLDRHIERKRIFEEQNPNITIIGDNYSGDPKTFMIKASANQLPNVYTTYFTETKKIITNGFAADITEELNKLGWTQYINPELITLLKNEQGRIFGIPLSAYAQGLFINKKIFKEAGLVNEDGSIMIPETLKEMAEFSQVIKTKTGKAGYVIPTVDNIGGWHFLNIAWNYGVSFMEVGNDGKYKATFDTQECRDALRFVYDLQWKYDVLPNNKVINLVEYRKLFGTGQVGMTFMDPPGNEFVQKYGMSKDDIIVASMPAGPKGRFSQMGGGVYMFSANSTSEQIIAGLKWLSFNGYGPTSTEEQLARTEESTKSALGKGEIIMDRAVFDVWVETESNLKKKEIRSKYCNVDMANYEHYYKFEDVIIKPEEPVFCQELYSVLDRCLQEVITNKNADIDALISRANNDFQANYLDKQ